MGLRLHKMMGWGWDDLIPDDPRINWESTYFKTGFYSREALEGYVEYITKLEATESYLIGHLELSPQELYSCITFGSEESFNYFCASPVSSPDWRRSGDSIDFEEDFTRYGDGDMEDKALLLPHSPWPYGDSAMDIRTGELVKKSGDWSRFYLTKGEDKRREVMESSLGSFFAEQMGYSVEDAQTYLVLPVPHEIRNLLAYGDLLTDPKDAYSLKPMIFTWWA